MSNISPPGYEFFKFGDIVTGGLDNLYLVVPPCVYRERTGSHLSKGKMAVKYLREMTGVSSGHHPTYEVRAVHLALWKACAYE